MTYELAKKLKEAGFPLKPTQSQNAPQLPTDLVVENVRYEYPTLSELIEAVKLTKDFDMFYNKDGTWSVGSFGVPSSWQHDTDLAVALVRLWVANH